MNRAYFIGKIGSAPELRTSVSGGSVCVVDLAVTMTERIDGDTIERTDRHRLVSHGSEAAYLAGQKAGAMLAVECYVRPQKWTDKDGGTHRDVSIVIERVMWCKAARVTS